MRCTGRCVHRRLSQRLDDRFCHLLSVQDGDGKCADQRRPGPITQFIARGSRICSDHSSAWSAKSPAESGDASVVLRLQVRFCAPGGHATGRCCIAASGGGPGRRMPGHQLLIARPRPAVTRQPGAECRPAAVSGHRTETAFNVRRVRGRNPGKYVRGSQNVTECGCAASYESESVGAATVSRRKRRRRRSDSAVPVSAGAPRRPAVPDRCPDHEATPSARIRRRGRRRRR